MTILLLIFILVCIGIGLYVFHLFVAPKMDRRFVILVDIVVCLATAVWLVNLIFPGALGSPASVGCNPNAPIGATHRR